MKKKLLILLAVIVMLLIVSIPALAGPPEDAQGVWCYTPNYIAVEKVAGGNEFWTTSETAVWTGAFEGASVDHCRAVIHSSGAWWGVCEISFASVSVGGKTGALDMFAIVRRPSVLDKWDGSWTITAGSGALKGLRGQGTMSGPGWQGNPEFCGEINYSGNIHFEP